VGREGRGAGGKLTRPGYPGDAGGWSMPMRQLVGSHGAAAVYRVGLETLGYPPTWSHTIGEAMRVAEAIKGE